jgi:hypothetical protein
MKSTIPSFDKRPLVLLTAAVLTLTAVGADARERSHSRSATGINGGTASGEFAMQRGDGSASRYRWVAGPNGRGFTRDQNRECLDGLGCSSSSQTTTASGQSFGRSASTTPNGDGSYTRSVSGNTPSGASISRESTVTPATP